MCDYDLYVGISVALFLHLFFPPSLDVMVWTTDHVVEWAESVGLEDFAQSLHGSCVHGGVIALDDSFDAEALAMAMKIPQHLNKDTSPLQTKNLNNIYRYIVQV